MLPSKVFYHQQRVVIMSSKDQKMQVAEYFSGKNDFWETVYKENPRKDRFIHYHMRKRKEKVFEYLNVFADGDSIKVLDVGCGTGVFLLEMISRGYHAVGVDLSLRMVSDTKRKISAVESKSSSALCSDVQRLPFKDSYFDAVTCVGVLEYLKADVQTLLELKRVVRPGGAIIFTLPNKFKMKNIFDPYYYLVRIWKYIFIKLGIKKKKTSKNLFQYSTNEWFTNKRYKFSDLRNLTNKSGLKLEKFTGLGYGPLTVWQKELLPLKFNLKLNQRLEEKSVSHKLKVLDKIPNRWVINTRKIES